MQKLEKIRHLLTETEADVQKFYDNENKSAGTRIRQTMLEIKKLAQEMRLEIAAQKAKK